MLSVIRNVRLRRRKAQMSISMHRVLRTTARGLVAALFLLAFGRAEAQAIIKVNDNVNFRLGLLLQGQWDEQQIANSTNTATGGWAQNMLVRRARIVMGGQVAPNVFFFVETDNPNLGKTTVGGTGTGAKAPGTGFELQDAAGEWRIAKEFNIQFGEILVPTNRAIITSSTSAFMLDASAYYNLPSTALQNNAGRDTGFMVRGFLAGDHLEYRSCFLSGLRLPGVKNATRFTEYLQYDVFDTEVYALPSYAGANYGKRKILAIAGGKFITALPKQDTFSAEAGVFLKGLGIAPIIRYEQREYSDAVNKPKNEKRYVGGLNFYPYKKFENNFNIKAWFSRVEPKVGFATNEFTLQMQVAYF